jgi:uncharacterized protein (TIGR02594 family)
MLILRKGSSGADVTRLQHLLNSAFNPSPKLQEDGDFGDKTHAAVIRFQQVRSLTQDGTVGPQTWNALGQRISSPPSQPSAAPTAVASWMATAVAELGVHEESLPGQHNRRIIEYHSTTTLRATDDETPWCSSFVNWVMKTAGYRGTNSAAAKSWLDWGIKLTTPQNGAIVVIKRKKSGTDHATGSSSGFHVGFWVSETSTHIRLLGGNQSDQVKYSNFSLSGYEVKGYRWPNQ